MTPGNGAGNKSTELPIRADLVGRSPYGAPQLDVPVRLNTNENPFDPSPELVAELSRVISQVGANLNRYPIRAPAKEKALLIVRVTIKSGCFFRFAIALGVPVARNSA